MALPVMGTSAPLWVWRFCPLTLNLICACGHKPDVNLSPVACLQGRCRLCFVFCFFNMYLFGCSGSQLRHEGSQLQCMRSNSLTWAPCIGAKSLNHWTTREVSWMSSLDLGSGCLGQSLPEGKNNPNKHSRHRESPVPSTCSVTSTPHTASL